MPDRVIMAKAMVIAMVFFIFDSHS
jgi:hypothetical protein